jgi:hypothetical protein
MYTLAGFEPGGSVFQANSMITASRRQGKPIYEVSFVEEKTQNRYILEAILRLLNLQLQRQRLSRLDLLVSV